MTYRVFNVTSYSANNSTTNTIVGDGSGDPVVFNFAYSSNTNLGGQIVLTGGLTDDQVIWNFTSSGKKVQLNNNGGNSLESSFSPTTSTNRIVPTSTGGFTAAPPATCRLSPGPTFTSPP